MKSLEKGDFEKNSVSEYLYFHSIDWLRFLAAFGIVWFHNTEAKYRAIGYAGLPIFLLVFCALTVIHNKELSAKYYIRKKSRRLLLPWLFWSLIFVFIKFLKCNFGHFPSNFSIIDFLLIGGNIHLWYLPFAFVASMVLQWVCNIVFYKELNASFIDIILLLFIIIVTFCCSLLTSIFSIRPPFAQWVFSLPSIPLGFAIGYILRFKKKNVQLIQMGTLYFIFIAICLITYYFFKSPILLSYAIGLLLTIIAFCISIPSGKLSQKFGALTYGIYLIHPLILSFVKNIFNNQMFTVAIITFIISATIVYFLRLTKFKAIL